MTGILVYFTPRFMDVNGNYPPSYFILFFFYSLVNSIFDSTVFISQIAFFAKVSDPMIGGTYMTLLVSLNFRNENIFVISNVLIRFKTLSKATISNLGSMYPNTIALYLIGIFSNKACYLYADKTSLNSTFLVYSADSNTTVFNFNETRQLIVDNKCSTPHESKVIDILFNINTA